MQVLAAAGLLFVAVGLSDTFLTGPIDHPQAGGVDVDLAIFRDRLNALRKDKRETTASEGSAPAERFITEI
jgi:hypothetical protein